MPGFRSDLPLLKGVYALTDPPLSRLDHVSLVATLLSRGVRWIQFRDKELPRKDLYRVARDLRIVTARHGAGLIVNDHLDIALMVQADGVHLGQEDLSLSAVRAIVPDGFIVGISTHDPEQAARAEREGADYIGFGPLFPTATKDAGAPRGVDGLRTVRESVSIPIAAIGGISVDNARDVADAGADLLAVASAIYTAGDWGHAVQTLQAAFDHES